MTNEEAIECLNRRLKCAEYVESDYCDSIDLEAIKTSINALEKQIPVKCECITQTWGTYCEKIWRCPKCRKDAVRGGFYCYNCGQRLSWITKRLNEDD